MLFVLFVIDIFGKFAILVVRQRLSMQFAVLESKHLHWFTILLENQLLAVDFALFVIDRFSNLTIIIVLQILALKHSPLHEFFLHNFTISIVSNHLALLLVIHEVSFCLLLLFIFVEVCGSSLHICVLPLSVVGELSFWGGHFADVGLVIF